MDYWGRQRVCCPLSPPPPPRFKNYWGGGAGPLPPSPPLFLCLWNLLIQVYLFLLIIQFLCIFSGFHVGKYKRPQTLAGGVILNSGINSWWAAPYFIMISPLFIRKGTHCHPHISAVATVRSKSLKIVSLFLVDSEKN